QELDEEIGVMGGSLGAEQPVGFVSPPGPAPYLRSDHDELERLAERALAIVEEGDSDAVRDLLARLEDRLNEHMAAEERELLPTYREVEPASAEAICAEHRNFRRLFAELAVAGDLHIVRLERVR